VAGLDGFTGKDTGVWGDGPGKNHDMVPVAQVPGKVIGSVIHLDIVGGTPVGAVGMGVTVTVTGAAGLLQMPLTQDA
jgi:hypothetical protein